MATPLHACRVCRSTSLEEVLSLGDLPPVNSFLSGRADIAAERKHPLAIAFCATCSHVQLTHMLDPKDVFEQYIYFSGMSETVVRWGESLAERYAGELSLAPSDLVVELASNDGCILKAFKPTCRVLGVEPAKNIAEVAVTAGVPTIVEFFDSKLAAASKGTHGGARLIIARNVVAHVPAVVDFLSGAADWLTDDGILHVEVPYLGEMVEKLEFDTIYHEHLSYFSVTTMNRLFAEAGLVLWDVEEIGLHGGSLVARGKRRGAAPKESVARYLAAERSSDLAGIAPLRRFAAETQRLKARIPEFLHEKKKEGALAAYGAAAKGVVLTNYCDVGTSLLDFVADRSPYKQGKLTPGMHLPVVAPERVLSAKPAHLVVLAWNFIDEIRKQLHAYEAGGGRFIVPVPQPRIA
jgi:hypothetical protein